MVLYALEKLSEAWGYTLNGKGYKVLNGIAVIQGDGMDFNSVKDLYTAVCDRRFAAQNVAVGVVVSCKNIIEMICLYR
jgi:nicotinamide phosphoribosyltransferase